MKRIDQYLYSVETTSARHGAVLLDALRLLSNARRVLVHAQEASVITEAQELLRSARSQVGNLESFPAIRELAAEIERIADETAPPENVAGALFPSYLAPLVARLTDVIQRTRALRRQDQLGTSPS